jgi:hypothetical protein
VGFRLPWFLGLGGVHGEEHAGGAGGVVGKVVGDCAGIGDFATAPVEVDSERGSDSVRI